MLFFIPFAVTFAVNAFASPMENSNAVTSNTDGISISSNSMIMDAEQTPEANCYWAGSAPFCSGTCPVGYREQNKDKKGDGSKCWSGYKAYCCRDNVVPTSAPAKKVPTKHATSVTSDVDTSSSDTTAADTDTSGDDTATEDDTTDDDTTTDEADTTDPDATT